MCMITYVPAGTEVPVEGITNGACANPHGHGWAVASKEHGLQVGKSMDSEVAIAEFTAARTAHGPDSLGLFHSRLATHGEVTEFNIHPFFVPGTDEKTVMAHNGILPSFWYPEKGDPRSDTRVFVDITAPDFITARGVPSRKDARYLGHEIRSTNKLVFLSVMGDHPTVRIVNPDSGVWHEGIWYSNDWFQKRRFGGGRWSTGGTASGRPTQGISHSGWGAWDEDYDGLWGWSSAAIEAYEASRAKADAEADAAAADEHAASGETGSSLDLPTATVTDVLTDFQCEMCQEVGSVHERTMVCLACNHCLDCFESVTNCDCFNWEEYLEKRQAEEALWVAGIRESVAAGAE